MSSFVFNPKFQTHKLWHHLWDDFELCHVNYLRTGWWNEDLLNCLGIFPKGNCRWGQRERKVDQELTHMLLWNTVISSLWVVVKVRQMVTFQKVVAQARWGTEVSKASTPSRKFLRLRNPDSGSNYRRPGRPLAPTTRIGSSSWPLCGHNLDGTAEWDHKKKLLDHTWGPSSTASCSHRGQSNTYGKPVNRMWVWLPSLRSWFPAYCLWQRS